MIRIMNMRDDLQAESSGSLFKSSLARAGHIVAAPLQAAQIVISRVDYCNSLLAGASKVTPDTNEHVQ